MPVTVKVQLNSRMDSTFHDVNQLHYNWFIVIESILLEISHYFKWLSLMQLKFNKMTFLKTNSKIWTLKNGYKRKWRDTFGRQCKWNTVSRFHTILYRNPLTPTQVCECTCEFDHLTNENSAAGLLYVE